MIKNEVDKTAIQSKMQVMQKLGVPYTDEEVANALAHWDKQATQIEENLIKNKDIRKSFEEQKAAQGADFIPVKDREVVALIAYLQRLGTDITKDNTK